MTASMIADCIVFSKSTAKPRLTKEWFARVDVNTVHPAVYPFTFTFSFAQKLNIFSREQASPSGYTDTLEIQSTKCIYLRVG